MLVLEKVTVRLGGIPILREVNIEIAKASTVALIGANGAGKTTTLRTIMGLTKMTGRIGFDGGDLTVVAPSRRPILGIGYAAEDRRLFSGFTVEENIKMPGQVARFSSDELQRRLARVYGILPELREMAGRPAGAVSGGQGKMVALGRALMIGSKLIMLDEPFQGLAPALARRYADALRKLRETDRNITLIITESNPELLKNFAERTLVIDRGVLRATRQAALA
ncbi:MAG: ATP-binding cassette domain-containing protein [Roseibium sp.]|nr:ATP-binding cassette domain-containing protein [Roseibium sp.]